MALPKMSEVSPQKKTAIYKKFRKALEEMKLPDGTPIQKIKGSYFDGYEEGVSFRGCALGVLREIVATEYGAVPKLTRHYYVEGKECWFLPKTRKHSVSLPDINDWCTSPKDDFSWELEYLEKNGPWDDFIEKKEERK